MPVFFISIAVIFALLVMYFVFQDNNSSDNWAAVITGSGGAPLENMKGIFITLIMMITSIIVFVIAFAIIYSAFS